MDVLALVGAVLAFAAILLGNSLEGGQLSALLNLPAFIIVMGGTLGAIILQTPGVRLRRALTMLKWVLQPPVHRVAADIQRMTDWSKVSRREGLLGLENIADATRDEFQKKGLELLVDGTDPITIRRILEHDSRVRVDAELAAVSVFRAMGGYAPTIGILGAVIGLIQVMGNLADPDQLGPGIATAFVATIYGVGFANLLFLPIADRLRAVVAAHAQAHDLYIEGLTAIAEGEHPRNIELRLNGVADL